MTGPLPATQRGTLLAAVKATPFGWPTASLDPSCGAATGNRRRDRSPKNGPTTKIHQSEVSTLSGDGRSFQETRTAALITERLRGEGFAVMTVEPACRR